MRFTFIAKHRGIWPVAWLCEALDVSRSGFPAWLRHSTIGYINPVEFEKKVGLA